MAAPRGENEGVAKVRTYLVVKWYHLECLN